MRRVGHVPSAVGQQSTLSKWRRSEARPREREKERERTREPIVVPLSRLCSLSLSSLLLSCEAFRLRNDGSETKARLKWPRRRATTRCCIGHLLAAAGGQKARVTYPFPPSLPLLPALPLGFWARNIYSLNARPCPFCLMRHVRSWLQPIELTPSPFPLPFPATLLHPVSPRTLSVFWPVNA